MSAYDLAVIGGGLAYRLPPIEQVHARRIVVVGGGDTALDTALSLKEVGHVTLVHRRAEFRASAHSQRLLDDAGIDVITGGQVVALIATAVAEGSTAAAAERFLRAA